MDFLKFQVFNKRLIEFFLSNDLLCWVSDIDKFNPFDREVIITKKIRQYKGIYFCFYSNRLDILFKPHYYFNNNLHNANDLKISDFIEIINEFKMIFNIDLIELKVVNIEFGINIISPIDVKDMISYTIYHEKNEFKNEYLPFSKISYKPTKRGKPNQYKIIKIYAKGLQHSQFCDNDTFRFEIKSKEAKYIKTLGISTALDLLNIDVHLKLHETLLKEFKSLLILDCHTDFCRLSASDQMKIKAYNNTLEWYKIRNKSSRNSFNNNKIRYHKLINQIENNLKRQMEKLVLEKLEILKAEPTSKIIS
jgi:hypothetical protein